MSLQNVMMVGGGGFPYLMMKDVLIIDQILPTE